MKKKANKGCVGNIVESVLSDPIQKKKQTEDLPSSMDSLGRYLEQQPEKKVRGSKKKDL